MTCILVVDDVPVVRLVIGKILRKAGHAVLEAGDGAEALALIEKQPVDLLVTDLWMPGADGVQLLRAVKTRFPSIAMVAISGGSPQSPLEESLDNARAAGAMVVLMKPVDKDELLRAVDSALLKRSR